MALCGLVVGPGARGGGVRLGQRKRLVAAAAAAAAALVRGVDWRVVVVHRHILQPQLDVHALSVRAHVAPGAARPERDGAEGAACLVEG